LRVRGNIGGIVQVGFGGQYIFRPSSCDRGNRSNSRPRRRANNSGQEKKKYQWKRMLPGHGLFLLNEEQPEPSSTYEGF